MAKFLIISPHYDDALLSCGSFIVMAKRMGHSIVILNVFTKFADGKPNTEIKKQLSKLDITVSEFEQQRKNEDKTVWKNLGIPKIDICLIDGGFRTQNNKNIYTNQQLFSGQISINDMVNVKKIQNILKKIDNKKIFDYFLVPYGYGSHIDHLITKKAAFKSINNNKIVEYLDQPYFSFEVKRNPWKKMSFYFRKKITISANLEKIRNLINYSSQLPFLFSSKNDVFFNEVLLVNKNEQFFSMNNFLK